MTMSLWAFVNILLTVFALGVLLGAIVLTVCARVLIFKKNHSDVRASPSITSGERRPEQSDRDHQG